MTKYWLTALGIITILLGLAFLWLYSHKLRKTAEDRYLDTLLHELSSQPIPDTALPITQHPPAPPRSPDSLPTQSLSAPVSAPEFTERVSGSPPRCPRCITIALIGVDSRINDPTAHADANHVLFLDLETGRITIVAIPRDTPADAGFPDTSQYNKLANVRAHRGRRAHLATLASLLGLPRIHYYAELGFSQALGILRLLQFANPSDVLRVLRARTGVWGDDYHRVYVQAHFLRQQLLRWFPTLNTPWGLALLRGALGLVETDLTVGVITRLADSLRARGFPQDSAAVSIVVYRTPLRRAPAYDLTDSSTVATLVDQLRRYHRRSTATSESHAHQVRNHLLAALDRAERAIASGHYRKAVQLLSPLVQRRAWWQLDESQEREAYRTALVETLCRAYEQLQQPQRAEALRNELLSTEQLLEHMVGTTERPPSQELTTPR
ncbi:MAG: hypothetical protein NZ960_07390 [Candidatus Kapabacteria bacterium]|nr:hypothetical protein [Candidatus Kapabacteria bacterium]MDW8012806.1 hypothetical protein [Bacteroidota bacterium]